MTSSMVETSIGKKLLFFIKIRIETCSNCNLSCLHNPKGGGFIQECILFIYSTEKVEQMDIYVRAARKKLNPVWWILADSMLHLASLDTNPFR